ncbi:alpha/beta hydrolase [Putridiphycobacter roseus]|uniref:Alpha/beta hydrolase n=1 Tax=Putridiphycobacter roseus TaxID=2219161 RepID=A0A2W1NFA9_9FLAO|nr:alpha/beta fold hydrolase [Putridiphycobacter roseus]PZE16706.1 alpha/beta hydrolase [Putridiphycobacter roseus]
MKLNYKKLGEAGPPLLILHGLFGSLDNWQTMGKKLAENFQVYLVDQRNHGHSPHSIEFNYDLMVEDLAELVNDLGLKDINLIGHSMGGKTAIGFAAEHEDLIRKLIVIDISHKQYPRHHDQILKGINSLDLSEIKTRGQASEVMSEYIQDPSVRQFLLKNLYWVEKGKLDWRMNVPVLTHQIDKIIEEVYFGTIDTPTLFIRGALSNYILASDAAEIHRKFTHAEIYTIQNAGHWVHAEAPDELYHKIITFLN